MNYHKRLIVDFDDTLAFTTNREWANAKPNLDLISKLNKLHREGWTIDIFTARGSISCATRAEAEMKYKPTMVEWLEKYNVKYDTISFEKPLGAYYIDDKSITPEEFLNIDIKKLEGGLSGSDLYSDGKFVHKKDERAHAVKEWFETVEGVNVPKVDRIVGDVLTMEYIEHNEHYFEDNLYVAICQVQDTLMKLKANLKPMNDYSFRDYVSRIFFHAENADIDTFYDVAHRISDFYMPLTFGHGDFGIKNMLFTNDHKLYLIDPIPDTFTSTELDAAKFIASLLINKYPSRIVTPAASALETFNDFEHIRFKLLVAAEIIRVYKYHPEKQFIKTLVENVLRQK